MKVKVIDFGYKKLPNRAHYNDAGADVCACPKDELPVGIWPHETVKIPLGLGVRLPDGYAAYVFPRSGLASRSLVCELPPIDSGYTGEIHAIVTNCSDQKQFVNPGDRIGQLVIMPVVLADFVPESAPEFLARGEGAFGSTGV